MCVFVGSSDDLELKGRNIWFLLSVMALFNKFRGKNMFIIHWKIIWDEEDRYIYIFKISMEELFKIIRFSGSVITNFFQSLG